MSELKNAAQIAQELDLTKQAVYTRLKTDTVLQQQLKKYTVKKGRRTYYNEQGQRLIKSQFIRKSNNNTPSNDNQLQFDMSDAAATTMGGAAPALEHKTAEQAKPDKVIDALLMQIEVKDNQIKDLQTALHMAQEQQKELSRALTESQEQQAALLSALTAQQALHAGTLQEHFQQQHSAGAETDGTACEHQQETSTAQPADAATVRTSGAETTASDDQSDAAAATTMGGRSAPASEEEQPKQTIIEKLKSLFKKQKGT